MPAFTLFIETDTSPNGAGIRELHPTVPFDAEDEVEAERYGRAKLAELVRRGAAWACVVVVSSPAGQLVAEFLHPKWGLDG
jgi:hypothetical protein